MYWEICEKIYLWWDFFCFFVELKFCYKPALTQTLELFFWSSLYVYRVKPQGLGIPKLRCLEQGDT